MLYKAFWLFIPRMVNPVPVSMIVAANKGHLSRQLLCVFVFLDRVFFLGVLIDEIWAISWVHHHLSPWVCLFQDTTSSGNLSGLSRTHENFSTRLRI